MKGSSRQGAIWTDGPDSEAARAYRGEGTLLADWGRLEALAREVEAATAGVRTQSGKPLHDWNPLTGPPIEGDHAGPHGPVPGAPEPDHPPAVRLRYWARTSDGCRPMGDHKLLLTDEQAEDIRRREMTAGVDGTERVMLAYHDRLARIRAEVERLLSSIWDLEEKALADAGRGVPTHRDAVTGCVGLGDHRPRMFGWHLDGGVLSAERDHPNACTADDAIRAEVSP